MYYEGYYEVHEEEWLEEQRVLAELAQMEWEDE